MCSAAGRRRRRRWPRHVECLVAGALLTVVIVDTAYIIGTVLNGGERGLSWSSQYT